MLTKVIFTFEMESILEDHEEILADLIEYLKNLLDANQYQCNECRDLEVKHFVEFKSDKEARLKELWDQAQEKYNDIHGKDNVLEALDNIERIEYNKLDIEVNG